MVALYVAGKKVAWDDAEKLFAEAAATQPVEFHDENGRVFATSVPGSEPVDWYAAPPPREPSRPPGPRGYTLREWWEIRGWDGPPPEDNE